MNIKTLLLFRAGRVYFLYVVETCVLLVHVYSRESEPRLNTSKPAEKSYGFCQGGGGYEVLSKWFVRICVHPPIKLWVTGPTSWRKSNYIC